MGCSVVFKGILVNEKHFFKITRLTDKIQTRHKVEIFQLYKMSLYVALRILLVLKLFEF